MSWLLVVLLSVDAGNWGCNMQKLRMRVQAEELLLLPASAGVSEPQTGPWRSWVGCCKCRGAAKWLPLFWATAEL